MTSARAVVVLGSVARQGSEIHISLTAVGQNMQQLTRTGHNLQQLTGRGLKLSEYQIVQQY